MGGVINQERPAAEQGNGCGGRGGRQRIAGGQARSWWPRRLHRESGAGEWLGAARDPLPAIFRVW
jgi:hypothetical protein